MNEKLYDKYITKYAPTYKKPTKPLAPISERLAHWSDAKENLKVLLGGELSIHKAVSYSLSESLLVDEVHDLLKGRLYEWFEAMPFLPSIYDLVNNCYTGATLKYAKGEKILTVKAGEKMMRLIPKVLKFMYDKTFDFEDFRLEHSRILNERTLSGELYLSIEPLDFLTMSDNDSNWTSCMNWSRGHGCYRAGTLEMMNSPCVLIAYLAASKPMELFDEKWNNKKWRSLVIVDEDFVITVKGYPYQNESLSKAVVSWIAELAEKNLGWVYPNETKVMDDCERFTTEVMYNDFCTCPHYYRGELPTYYNYSGTCACAWCGRSFYPPEESFVLCDDCEPIFQCENCGEWYHEDCLVYDKNGECFCKDCYEENYTMDYFTGEEIKRRSNYYYYLEDTDTWIFTGENPLDNEYFCFVDEAKKVIKVL